MKELELEIKKLIISSLNLEDIAPQDIISEDPLFNDGLGLDSIDALEMGIAIQQTYGIELKADSDDTRKHFYSVKTLTDFIKGHRTK
jgi:acyl carrier protein